MAGKKPRAHDPSRWWPLGSICLQRKVAFDPQFGRRFGEGRDGDRVAENIVKPAHCCRGGENQIGFNQPEIVTVARAQHQSVITKHNRLAVAVNCSVSNVKNGHRWISIVVDQGASRQLAFLSLSRGSAPIASARLQPGLAALQRHDPVPPAGHEDRS